MKTEMATETHNFVKSYDANGDYHLVRPVGAPAGKAGAHFNMRVDCSVPVTLERCRTIIRAASDMVGVDLVRIEIVDSVVDVTPDDIGYIIPRDIRDKEYCYDKRTDTLTIYDKKQVVYINEGGRVSRGDSAATIVSDCGL